MRIFAALAIAALLAVGCGEMPTSDRQGEGGRRADEFGDVTDVTIWRNVDDVPNVAEFCAGEHEFVATLSADGTRSPELIYLGIC